MSKATTDRKILHIDMDAFYASVEQRDNRDLRGKPVIVGGKPDQRGVVAACSYEARAFGVRSAMPAARALRLCPGAILVKPRFSIYRQVSAHIREIFRRVTDRVEPLSLDEAYLDVTGSTDYAGSATRVAEAVKQCIRSELRLTASAGVSYNKFLAKIASDVHKPDGIYVITPEQGADFVADLPIGRFPGIGPVTQKRLQRLGVNNGADLRSLTLEALRPLFGRGAEYYYAASRGEDDRPVQSSRETRSVSAETTFSEDMTDTDSMLTHLTSLAGEVCASLQKQALFAFTLTIKVRYADFVLVTRSRTRQSPLEAAPHLTGLLADLLQRTQAGHRPVRLLGVAASNLIPQGKAAEQLNLFVDL
ncbi:MAG: DNA polymerase IV [Gammaproteobacteria bacterium]|nr:DNA polymerase IV [Gammaproteobacteria bacterium]